MTTLAAAKRYVGWMLKGIMDHAGNAQAATGWPDCPVSFQSFSDYKNGKYDIPASKLVELARLNRASHVFRHVADAIDAESDINPGASLEALAKRSTFTSVDLQRAVDDVLADGRVTPREKKMLEDYAADQCAHASAIKKAVEQLE